MDKDRVWSARRSLPSYPRRSGTSNNTAIRTPPPGLIGEWNSSGPLDNSRSRSLQTLSSAGETSVKMRRISSAPEMHPDRKNAAGHRERVTKAVGTIASCILAGSCIQAGDRNPELASLIVSGHVDVLSAKVCTLSLDLLLEGDGSSSESGTSEDFRPAGAPRAPRLVDPEVEHRGYRGSSGSTTSTQSEALTEFLEAGPSAAADEASCLASGALPDEPPGGGETASVRRESSACLSRGARLGRGGRPRGRRVSGYRES